MLNRPQKFVIVDIISLNFEHANFNYAFYLSLAKYTDVNLYLSSSSADYLRKSGLILDKNIHIDKIVVYLPLFVRVIYSYFFCLRLVFSSRIKLIISGYELRSFLFLTLFFPILMFKRNRVDLISHNHFEKFLNLKYKFLVFWIFRIAGLRFIALSISVKKGMLLYFKSKNVAIVLHPIVDKISNIDLKLKTRETIDFFSIGRHTRKEQILKILNLFNSIQGTLKRLNLPISTKKYLESIEEIDVKSVNFFHSEDRKQYLKILESMDILILPYSESLQYRASGVALDSVFYGNLILCEQPYYNELHDSFTSTNNFDFTKILSIQYEYEMKMNNSVEKYCFDQI